MTCVPIVSQYVYLRTTLSDDLAWSANIDNCAKKAIDRMFCLRKLKEYKVCQCLQMLFYTSTIQSVMPAGVAAWGGGRQQSHCLRQEGTATGEAMCRKNPGHGGS